MNNYLRRKAKEARPIVETSGRHKSELTTKPIRNKSRRSGKLVATNDHVIQQLLSDPNYRVTEDGVIWTRVSKQGHITRDWRPKGVCDKQGYKWFNFAKKKVSVHRLVYAAHKGPLESDLVVNHIDGNPSNNHPSNLELVSQSQNNLHIYRTLKRPAVKGFSKINQSIADEIRRLVSEENKRASELAKIYGLSKSTISYILSNRTWKS